MTWPSAGGYVHATAVVVEDRGVLIEGASRSGKSSLALALLDDARAAGRSASLVGDDRVQLTASQGQVVARPHPAIAGLIERRGVGILQVAHEAACVVHLIVSLEQDDAALPDRPQSAAHRTIRGVKLPVLTLRSSADMRQNIEHVLARLFALHAGP